MTDRREAGDRAHTLRKEVGWDFAHQTGAKSPPQPSTQSSLARLPSTSNASLFDAAYASTLSRGCTPTGGGVLRNPTTSFIPSPSSSTALLFNTASAVTAAAAAGSHHERHHASNPLSNSGSKSFPHQEVGQQRQGVGGEGPEVVSERGPLSFDNAGDVSTSAAASLFHQVEGGGDLAHQFDFKSHNSVKEILEKRNKALTGRGGGGGGVIVDRLTEKPSLQLPSMRSNLPERGTIEAAAAAEAKRKLQLEQQQNGVSPTSAARSSYSGGGGGGRLSALQIIRQQQHTTNNGQGERRGGSIESGGGFASPVALGRLHHNNSNAGSVEPSSFFSATSQRPSLLQSEAVIGQSSSNNFQQLSIATPVASAAAFDPRNSNAAANGDNGSRKTTTVVPSLSPARLSSLLHSDDSLSSVPAAAAAAMSTAPGLFSLEHPHLLKPVILKEDPFYTNLKAAIGVGPARKLMKATREWRQAEEAAAASFELQGLLSEAKARKRLAASERAQKAGGSSPRAGDGDNTTSNQPYLSDTRRSSSADEVQFAPTSMARLRRAQTQTRGDDQHRGNSSSMGSPAHSTWGGVGGGGGGGGVGIGGGGGTVASPHRRHQPSTSSSNPHHSNANATNKSSMGVASSFSSSAAVAAAQIMGLAESQPKPMRIEEEYFFTEKEKHVLEERRMAEKHARRQHHHNHGGGLQLSPSSSSSSSSSSSGSENGADYSSDFDEGDDTATSTAIANKSKRRSKRHHERRRRQRASSTASIQQMHMVMGSVVGGGDGDDATNKSENNGDGDDDATEPPSPAAAGVPSPERRRREEKARRRRERAAKKAEERVQQQQDAVLSVLKPEAHTRKKALLRDLHLVKSLGAEAGARQVEAQQTALRFTDRKNRRHFVKDLIASSNLAVQRAKTQNNVCGGGQGQGEGGGYGSKVREMLSLTYNNKSLGVGVAKAVDADATERHTHLLGGPTNMSMISNSALFRADRLRRREAFAAKHRNSQHPSTTERSVSRPMAVATVTPTPLSLPTTKLGHFLLPPIRRSAPQQSLITSNDNDVGDDNDDDEDAFGADDEEEGIGSAPPQPARSFFFTQPEPIFADDFHHGANAPPPTSSAAATSSTSLPKMSIPHQFNCNKSGDGGGGGKNAKHNASSPLLSQKSTSALAIVKEDSAKQTAAAAAGHASSSPPPTTIDFSNRKPKKNCNEREAPFSSVIPAKTSLSDVKSRVAALATRVRREREEDEENAAKKRRAKVEAEEQKHRDTGDPVVEPSTTSAGSAGFSLPFSSSAPPNLHTLPLSSVSLQEKDNDDDDDEANADASPPRLTLQTSRGMTPTRAVAAATLSTVNSTPLPSKKNFASKSSNSNTQRPSSLSQSASLLHSAASSFSSSAATSTSQMSAQTPRWNANTTTVTPVVSMAKGGGRGLVAAAASGNTDAGGDSNDHDAAAGAGSYCGSKTRNKNNDDGDEGDPLAGVGVASSGTETATHRTASSSGDGSHHSKKKSPLRSHHPSNSGGGAVPTSHPPEGDTDPKTAQTGAVIGGTTAVASSGLSASSGVTKGAVADANSSTSTADVNGHHKQNGFVHNNRIELTARTSSSALSSSLTSSNHVTADHYHQGNNNNSRKSQKSNTTAATSSSFWPRNTSTAGGSKMGSGSSADLLHHRGQSNVSSAFGSKSGHTNQHPNSHHQHHHHHHHFFSGGSRMNSHSNLSVFRASTSSSSFNHSINDSNNPSRQPSAAVRAFCEEHNVSVEEAIVMMAEERAEAEAERERQLALIATQQAEEQQRRDLIAKFSVVSSHEVFSPTAMETYRLAVEHIEREKKAKAAVKKRQQEMQQLRALQQQQQQHGGNHGGHQYTSFSASNSLLRKSSLMPPNRSGSLLVPQHKVGGGEGGTPTNASPPTAALPVSPIASSPSFHGLSTQKRRKAPPVKMDENSLSVTETVVVTPASPIQQKSKDGDATVAVPKLTSFSSSALLYVDDNNGHATDKEAWKNGVPASPGAVVRVVSPASEYRLKRTNNKGGKGSGGGGGATVKALSPTALSQKGSPTRDGSSAKTVSKNDSSPAPSAFQPPPTILRAGSVFGQSVASSASVVLGGSLSSASPLSSSADHPQSERKKEKVAEGKGDNKKSQQRRNTTTTTTTATASFSTAIPPRLREPTTHEGTTTTARYRHISKSGRVEEPIIEPEAVMAAFEAAHSKRVIKQIKQLHSTRNRLQDLDRDLARKEAMRPSEYIKKRAIVMKGPITDHTARAMTPNRGVWRDTTLVLREEQSKLLANETHQHTLDVATPILTFLASHFKHPIAVKICERALEAVVDGSIDARAVGKVPYVEAPRTRKGKEEKEARKAKETAAALSSLPSFAAATDPHSGQTVKNAATLQLTRNFPLSSPQRLFVDALFSIAGPTDLLCDDVVSVLIYTAMFFSVTREEVSLMLQDKAHSLVMNHLRTLKTAVDE